MKPLIGLIILSCLTIALVPVTAQQTDITAEAIGQVNLRADATVESQLIGEIFSGARYPVIGRSEFFPWFLLGDPRTGEPIGWVFQELVTIQGNALNAPLSTIVVSRATPSAPLLAPPTATPSEQINQSQIIPTATPGSAVTGKVQGEINIRYGPGADYPRIGVGQVGEQFDIVAYHTQFDWVQIRYPDAPNGLAWVARFLLDIEGNVLDLPGISQSVFAFPTLTPTPSAISQSVPPGNPQIPLSPEFQQLASRLWNLVLNSGFDPQTSRFGGLFLMDLQTGEAITFGEDTAFSATSINKIAILARLYGTLPTPPTENVATDIANTMICSDNAATNRLLSIIGGGDEYQGADEVTRFTRSLGIERTFLTAPYIVDPNNIPIPPRPIQFPVTDADQQRANPDPANQLTVDEMGWLLASMYQCGYQESGPLLELYSDFYESRECRQMLHVMSENTVDALLKAGVPANTRAAHKHGWINDTHGNAGVFFTPGGDYVLVMMLHQPQWLNFQESLPLIAEVSRNVYNYYNPDEPLPAIRDGFIPDANTCNFAGTPLIADLMSPVWDR